ncbi:transposase [Spirosoma litoris]
MCRYEIADQQSERINHLLPGKVGHVGRSAIDNRLFINTVLWIARSGAPWRDFPERFGPATAARLEFSLSTVSALSQSRCLENRF